MSLQSCLGKIIVVIWLVHQKAAHEQGDVWLVPVRLKQIAIEILSGGLEFFLNGRSSMCSTQTA